MINGQIDIKENAKEILGFPCLPEIDGEFLCYKNGRSEAENKILAEKMVAHLEKLEFIEVSELNTTMISPGSMDTCPSLTQISPDGSLTEIKISPNGQISKSNEKPAWWKNLTILNSRYFSTSHFF